ncbi:MAG: aldo/keto reductase [Alphaproteobacteria bacterium]|nr:MAG: aldo/keto reductase [Alphaproteobacteria bacterium]
MTSTPPRISLPHGPEIRRLIVGLWQMADQERDGKPFDLDRAAEVLVGYARAGFDSFDMADHYGSAEIVAGMAHRALREAGETPPTILTKWCPAPGAMGMDVVRKGVETALERLGLDRIDVMQFHWWQYAHPAWLDALENLMRLREEGLIGAIGLTNFDAAHLDLAAKSGIEIATNQVSASVIDRRALGAMSEVAAAHGVGLLAYGSLLGGFLSGRYLGAEDPAEISDWSRMKYRRMIEAAGGWERFQAVMAALGGIARRHGVSLSNVASRWLLDQPAISALIIGARLGESEHRADNLRVFDFALDAEDRAALDAALAGLDPVPGDCGDEYRKPPFLTASGDLSHHLDSLPPVYPVTAAPARPGRQRVESGSPWEAVAGYCRALRNGNRILVSGTTATDPHGRCVGEGDAGAQAVYILDKIIAAITSLGGRAEDVIRTRIYLVDLDDCDAVCAAHARYFGEIRPANTLIGIAGLVGPYLVEIEAEAEIG